MGGQELVCDWQQAASNVLVAVGKRFIGKVMEEVLSKFQPGALPHYYVVQTLANLAASNGTYLRPGGAGRTSPHLAPGYVAQAPSACPWTQGLHGGQARIGRCLGHLPPLHSVRHGSLPDVHPEHHAAHAGHGQARYDEGSLLLW